MASFKATIGGASPLRIQLGTSSTGVAEVRGFVAEGESATGSASRPALTRPSTPGSGTGTALPLDGHSVSGSTIVTSFSSSPTTPTVISGSFNLPMRVVVRFPKGTGLVLGKSSHVLLYAASSGGHTWSGELEWEEL